MRLSPVVGPCQDLLSVGDDLPNGACTTVTNCGGAAGSIVSFDESVVRAGANFKFGPQ